MFVQCAQGLWAGSPAFVRMRNKSDPSYVFSGGLNQFGLTTNVRFRGCIRSLKLTKGTGKPLEVNFAKALELRGVQPVSCPTT